MSDIIKATITEPHYWAPDEQEVKDALARHDMGGQIDLSTTLAAIDAGSYILRDGTPQESFMDLGSTSNPAIASAIQSAIQAVDFSKLSGRTPLEKAIAFNALAKSAGGVEEMAQMQSAGLGDKVQKILDKMSAQQAAIEAMMKSGNDFAKEALNFDPSAPEISALNLSEEEKETLTAMAAIAAIGEIQSKRVAKLIPQIGGKIMKPHLMEYHEELPLITDISEMLLPDFLAKLANQELFVRRFYEEELSKLAAIIQIDRSSSMNVSWKQGYVRAILLHYFGLLSKGEATLYVGTFERQSDGVKLITNETEAKEFYKEYRQGNGGGTDVNNVIQTIQTNLERHKVGKYNIPPHQTPELIIVNDGQDRVKVETYPKPIHVISLEVDNTDLQQVAKQSGGSYNVFTRSGR